MERHAINIATLVRNIATADQKGFVCTATFGPEVTLYELGEILGIKAAGLITESGQTLQEHMDPSYMTSTGAYKPCAAVGCYKCYR